MREPIGRLLATRLSNSRSSPDRGGLLMTPSTCADGVPSSFINAPQPVSMMTGVPGDSVLIAPATCAAVEMRHS